jgi:hypothetical protein
VTVRVVERSDPEMLLAVFEGNLGVLSHSKHPALSSGLSAPSADMSRSMRRTLTTSEASVSMSRLPASTCIAIASEGARDVLDALSW